MRRFCLSLFALLALAPASASAAPGWVFEKVALSGELAPGSTRAYTSFDNARSAGADAAFGALLLGSPPQWGAYLRDAGGVDAVSLFGETAPGTGGGTYSIFFATPSRKGETVSFASTIAGGTTTLGVFVDAGAGDVAAMLFGDPAPGGGTFAPRASDVTIHSVNASGEVAFRSTLAGAASTQGVFVTGAGVTSIAELGGAGPGSGTWTTLGWPSLNDAGEVAFEATTSGGFSASGVYVYDGSVAPLVQAGDPAPDTGGAVFDRFFYPAMGDSGTVAFLAEAVGGSAGGGLFIASPSIGIEAVVVENQLMPNTEGRGLATFGPSLPNLNADDSTAFAGVLSGSPAASGVFLHDGATGAIHSVALTGDLAPEAGGATFTLFEYVGLDDDGVVSFEAALSDGRSGIFVAMPGGTPVPSVTPRGIMMLVVLLTSIATASLANRD